MYKIYLKQALQMLQQDKLISAISIAGTALALTLIMVIVMVKEVRTANLAPEVNRSRALYVTGEDFHLIDSQTNDLIRSPLQYTSLKECLYRLKTPEYVSAWMLATSALVSMEGSNQRITSELKPTDDTFWKAMSFTFIDGNPFSKEDFEAGLKVAVISRRTAQRIFEGENAIGRNIELNFQPYRVVGVVNNVSTLCKNAYSDIWIPYTSVSYQNAYFKSILIAHSRSDFDAIRSEVLAVEAAYNSSQQQGRLELNGPYTQAEQLLEIGAKSHAADAIVADRRRTIVVLTIILLVPAINLAGFSMSKLKKRIGELGVRKAFGARRLSLLMQVLYENMLSSLIGGVLGLFLSAICVGMLRNSLLDDWEMRSDGSLTIPLGSLFSPAIFFYVFVVCVALNLLSTFIPAYRASRLPIVQSLKG